jgi:CRP-like cAMP-binding protein
LDEASLKSVPLFESLGRKELRRVAQSADEVEVPEGKHLADQGAFAYEFFVIEEGTAEVTVDGERRGDLGPGDFFGEIGLLKSERRTATVVAQSPMRLIVMTRSGFRSIERDMPHVAEQVESAIESRLAADREARGV